MQVPEILVQQTKFYFQNVSTTTKITGTSSINTSLWKKVIDWSSPNKWPRGRWLFSVNGTEYGFTGDITKNGYTYWNYNSDDYNKYGSLKVNWEIPEFEFELKGFSGNLEIEFLGYQDDNNLLLVF